MPPRRLEPLTESVTLEVDGKEVEARPGEPVAVALTAAGRLTLGRSVKYHRPRGAVCYGGRCDGCLMRVDGVQSVTTCRHPVADGMVVETQNVLGSAKMDLLAATDWFFRGGMNHHEMFTWNEAVNKVMQKVARRIAGIGTLPDEAPVAIAPEQRQAEVLVIGAGPAGLAAAEAHAAAGRDVHVIDEEPEPGGFLGWWPGRVHFEAEAHLPSLLAAQLAERADEAGARLYPNASAVAIYPPHEDVPGAGEGASVLPAVLVDTPERLYRFHAGRIVFACGRHAGVPPFSDSDTPGVIDVPAAGRLLAHRVLPGEEILVAGEGPDVVALVGSLKTHGATVHGPYAVSAIRDVIGRPALSGCELELQGERRKVRCDSIVAQGPSSAVYELASQAGVEVRWAGQGFELVADAETGATAVDGVSVVGGAAGIKDDLDRAVAQARAEAAT